MEPSAPILPPGLPSASPSPLPVSRLVTAMPDFLLAGAFLTTWISPFALGEQVVPYLMLVMLLEFLIVHSSGFMGSVLFNDPLSRNMKLRMLLGFGAFYVLFALAFSAAFSAWWPLWTIALLTVNRMLIVVFGTLPKGEERRFIQRGWAVSAALYVVLALLTTMLPVPRAGLPPDVVRSLDLPGGGLWIDEPNRVLAFGFLYFFAVAVSELFSHRWLPTEFKPSPALESPSDDPVRPPA